MVPRPSLGDGRGPCRHGGGSGARERRVARLGRIARHAVRHEEPGPVEQTGTRPVLLRQIAGSLILEDAEAYDRRDVLVEVSLPTTPLGDLASDLLKGLTCPLDFLAARLSRRPQVLELLFEILRRRG